MTTYYVSNTGSDALNGQSTANAWQTVNKVNNTAFSPGDVIRFKCGGIWRETLVTSTNGNSSSPITYSSYDVGTNPTICGADITALTWTNTSGNIWRASRTTNPGVVRVNGTIGVKEALQANLNAANEWYWDGSTFIYLYSTTNPGGKTVEMCNRNYEVVANKNYIVFENLIVEMTTGYGNIVIAAGGTNNVTVRNCEVRYSDLVGILIDSGAGAPHLIESNTVHHCLKGIHGNIYTGASSGNEVIVRGNDCYGNGEGAIINRGNWWIIENNYVHDNGDPLLVATVGIWIISGGIGEGTGHNNIIRYNLVTTQDGKDWDGGGIGIDQWCDNNDIYGNVVYACRSYGITLVDAKFINIYNNTCFANETATAMFSGEIAITSNAYPVNRSSDINVINNIGYSTQASSVAVFIDANTASNANILFTNNIWFGTSTNWWTNGATNGTSLAVWNLNSFVGTDLNVDPQFIDISTFKLWVASSSAAYRAGSSVNSAASLLSWVTTWPSGVTLLANPRRDIGAYQVLPFNISAVLAPSGKLGATASSPPFQAQAALAAAGKLAAAAFALSPARVTLAPSARLDAIADLRGTVSASAILGAAGALSANATYAFGSPRATLAAAGALAADVTIFQFPLPPQPPYVGVLANKGTDVMEMVTTNLNADMELLAASGTVVGRLSPGFGPAEAIPLPALMRAPVYAFNNLPASSMIGDLAQVTDSSVNTLGAPAAGGGIFRVLVWFNGTDWTVIGK